MKINLSIKQKIFLVSGLLIIIIILLIGLVVKPLLGEIEETSFLVEESQEKLLLLKDADHRHLEQLEVEYEEIRNDISLVNSSFLEIDQVVDFIVGLETFASLSANKLEIKDVNYPIFSLQLISGFSNLMKYLGLGERTPPPGEEAVLIGNIRSILEIESQTKPLNYE
jgi:hypothetical protein